MNRPVRLPDTVSTRVEQRRERGDLIALRAHGDLGQDNAGAGVSGAENRSTRLPSRRPGTPKGPRPRRSPSDTGTAEVC